MFIMFNVQCFFFFQYRDRCLAGDSRNAKHETVQNAWIYYMRITINLCVCEHNNRQELKWSDHLYDHLIYSFIACDSVHFEWLQTIFRHNLICWPMLFEFKFEYHIRLIGKYSKEIKIQQKVNILAKHEETNIIIIYQEHHVEPWTKLIIK